MRKLRKGTTVVEVVIAFATKTFDVQRRSADNFIQYQPKP